MINIVVMSKGKVEIKTSFEQRMLSRKGKDGMSMKKSTNILYSAASFVWRNTLLKWYRGCQENKKKKYWQEHKKRFGGGGRESG